MTRTLTSGRRWQRWLSVAIVTLMASGTAQAQSRDRSPHEKTNAPSPLAQHYRPLLEAELRGVANCGDVASASEALRQSFDQVALRADISDHDLFIDAAFAMRMMRLMQDVPEEERASYMAFLLEHPDVARALAFVAVPGLDEMGGVYALLNRLKVRHSALLDRYANLVAALCVVHDEPLKRRVNENTTVAPDPVALFEYFVANEDHLVFPVRSTPPELLVYVVDSTASIDEMRWALGQYRGHRKVGALFFTIKYDYDHLEGDVKDVTRAGFSLPNIARHGGVCADQAYFACAVGKAIGVPTTYTRGASGEVSHAWVGYLESTKRAAWWDFSSGRYEAYQGVRGVVTDPQTGRRVSDSSVALLAEYATASQRERYATIAMTDAAVRLFAASNPKRPIKLDAGNVEGEPARGVTRAAALELLEAALRTCPGYESAWDWVAGLAQAGEFSFEDKQKWATVLHRLCGEKYPDFYFAVVAPMIESVGDVEAQNRMWNAAFRAFQRRHDLAAAVRLKQAEMWRKHGDKNKAGQCCEDVISRYANAGPFVLQALEVATNLLAEMNKHERIPALYERAWSLTKKPDTKWAPQFYRQSNWYRVGAKYSEVLAKNGRGAEAESVRTALGAR